METLKELSSPPVGKQDKNKFRNKLRVIESSSEDELLSTAYFLEMVDIKEKQMKRKGIPRPGSPVASEDELGLKPKTPVRKKDGEKKEKVKIRKKSKQMSIESDSDGDETPEKTPVQEKTANEKKKKVSKARSDSITQNKDQKASKSLKTPVKKEKLQKIRSLFSSDDDCDMILPKPIKRDDKVKKTAILDTSTTEEEELVAPKPRFKSKKDKTPKKSIIESDSSEKEPEKLPTPRLIKEKSKDKLMPVRKGFLDNEESDLEIPIPATTPKVKKTKEKHSKGMEDIEKPKTKVKEEDFTSNLHQAKTPQHSKEDSSSKTLTIKSEPGTKEKERETPKNRKDREGSHHREVEKEKERSKDRSHQDTIASMILELKQPEILNLDDDKHPLDELLKKEARIQAEKAKDRKHEKVDHEPAELPVETNSIKVEEKTFVSEPKHTTTVCIKLEDVEAKPQTACVTEKSDVIQEPETREEEPSMKTKEEEIKKPNKKADGKKSKKPKRKSKGHEELVVSTTDVEKSGELPSETKELPPEKDDSKIKLIEDKEKQKKDEAKRGGGDNIFEKMEMKDDSLIGEAHVLPTDPAEEAFPVVDPALPPPKGTAPVSSIRKEKEVKKEAEKLKETSEDELQRAVESILGGASPQEPAQPKLEFTEDETSKSFSPSKTEAGPARELESALPLEETVKDEPQEECASALKELEEAICTVAEQLEEREKGQQLQEEVENPAVDEQDEEEARNAVIALGESLDPAALASTEAEDEPLAVIDAAVSVEAPPSSPVPRSKVEEPKEIKKEPPKDIYAFDEEEPEAAVLPREMLRPKVAHTSAELRLPAVISKPPEDKAKEHVPLTDVQEVKLPEIGSPERKVLSDSETPETPTRGRRRGRPTKAIRGRRKADEKVEKDLEKEEPRITEQQPQIKQDQPKPEEVLPQEKVEEKPQRQSPRSKEKAMLERFPQEGEQDAQPLVLKLASSLLDPTKKGNKKVEAPAIPASLSETVTPVSVPAPALASAIAPAPAPVAVPTPVPTPAPTFIKTMVPVQVPTAEPILVQKESKPQVTEEAVEEEQKEGEKLNEDSTQNVSEVRAEGEEDFKDQETSPEPKREESKSGKKPKGKGRRPKEEEEEEEEKELPVQRSPSTRGRSKQEELSLKKDVPEVTEKYSSRGRKIIPKGHADELTPLGRKGRKPIGIAEAEPESRGRGRRGAISPAASTPEPEVGQKGKFMRGRRISTRLAKDEELLEGKQEEKKVEDPKVNDNKEENEKEEEGSDGEEALGRCGRRTPRRRKSTRRSVSGADEGLEKEGVKDEEEESKDGIMDEISTGKSETDTSTAEMVESPKPRKTRRSKARKSIEGQGMSPRRIDGTPGSPRAKGLESGSTSPKEFSKPIVKLEKLSIVEQTLRSQEGSRTPKDEGIRKEDDHHEEREMSVTAHPFPRVALTFSRTGLRSSNAAPSQPQDAETIVSDKQPTGSKQKKDLYEWEDDDEKPPPDLIHARPRKRKIMSPRFEDVAMDPTSLPDSKKLKMEEKPEESEPPKATEAPDQAKERDKNEEAKKEKEDSQETDEKNIYLDPKTGLLEPMPSSSTIREAPSVQEQKPEPVPKPVESKTETKPVLSSIMEAAPKPPPVVCPPSEPHFPPKLEFKKHEDVAPKAVATTHFPGQAVPAPVKSEPTVGPLRITIPLSNARQDNMDKVINAVARGEFNREDEYDFYTKKKGRSRSQEQVSPQSMVEQKSLTPVSTLGMATALAPQGLLGAPGLAFPLVNTAQQPLMAASTSNPLTLPQAPLVARLSTGHVTSASGYSSTVTTNRTTAPSVASQGSLHPMPQQPPHPSHSALQAQHIHIHQVSPVAKSPSAVPQAQIKSPSTQQHLTPTSVIQQLHSGPQGKYSKFSVKSIVYLTLF